jgi:hypothetical protein
MILPPEKLLILIAGLSASSAPFQELHHRFDSRLRTQGQ